MHQLLKHALVVWILRVAIPLNLQKVFNEAEYSDCYEILNCAEAVIEQSKSLHNQACAWSDYKRVHGQTTSVSMVRLEAP